MNTQGGGGHLHSVIKQNGLMSPSSHYLQQVRKNPILCCPLRLRETPRTRRRRRGQHPCPLTRRIRTHPRHTILSKRGARGASLLSNDRSVRGQTYGQSNFLANAQTNKSIIQTTERTSGRETDSPLRRLHPRTPTPPLSPCGAPPRYCSPDSAFRTAVLSSTGSQESDSLLGGATPPGDSADPLLSMSAYTTDSDVEDGFPTSKDKPKVVRRRRTRLVVSKTEQV